MVRIETFSMREFRIDQQVTVNHVADLSGNSFQELASWLLGSRRSHCDGIES